MGDTRKFEITKVRRATRYKACRGAVLNPVFGCAWLSWGVEEAMQKLRLLWHKKLIELRNAGWEKVQDSKDHQYMRNCPPFGVVTDDTTMRCGVPLVCPFCWARRFVLEPFMKVETALYSSFHKNAKIVLPHKHLYVVEFTRTHKLAPLDGVPWTDEIKAAMPAYAKSIIGTQRQTEIDIFRPLGGVVLHRLDPQTRCWRLTRNGVLIGDYPEGLSLTEELRELKEKKLFNAAGWPRDYITKDRLYRAFSRRFHFPAGVVNAETQDVLFYIEGLRGVRMLSTFGICREERFQKHFGD